MLRAIMIMIWLLMLSITACAQMPDLSGLQKPQAVPASLASPRATMKTYLEGMNNADIDQAISTLDLGRMTPPERAERGPQLAFQLWAILNRQEYIEVAKLSDSPDADTFQLAITKPDGQPAGRVDIQRSGDGAFRFSAATIESLPTIWNAVRSKPVIRGLSDPTLQSFAPEEYMSGLMSEETRKVVFGLAIWKWILLAFSLILATIGILIIRLLTELLGRAILRLPKDSQSRADINRGGNALCLVALSHVANAYYQFFGFSLVVASIVGVASRIGIVVGWLLFAFALWDLGVTLYIRRVGNSTQAAERLVTPVLSRLGKAFIIVTAAIYVLSAVGINVTAFIATLGIGGLVIALAAKDSVENLFGSVMVLVERPFQIGDWIRIKEVSGEVEDIRLRSTRIRTFEDSVIVLPNRALITENVENYGARRHRRFKTELDLPIDTKASQLANFTERVRQLLSNHPKVFDQEQFVFLNDFGPTSRKVLFYCFLDVSCYEDELRFREQILLEVLQIAESMGIQFAASAALAIKPESSHPSDNAATQ